MLQATLQAPQTAASLDSFGALQTDTSALTCQRVRFKAADLCRQGRLAEADLLTYEALQQYPDSEDVLVMRALICEVRHDWSAAAAVLERLVRLQGKGAPAASWCQWVRVLRCDGRLAEAHQAVRQALQQHPGHPALASELAQLEAMGVEIGVRSHFQGAVAPPGTHPDGDGAPQ